MNHAPNKSPASTGGGTDTPAIAKTELIRIRKSGERVPLCVEIGQPQKTSDGVWHTPIALHGLDGRLSDICGEDSLQSLCLATEMVHARLAAVIESGERLVDSDNGDFSIKAYFPKRGGSS
jgi:hypothetical protein